ncbi:MAG: YbhN family protein [Malacoplasma sp.]
MQFDTNKNNQFFNKKKIINLSIFFCLTIIIIVLTLTLVLNIDVNKLINDIIHGLNINKYQFLFAIFLIMFPFVKSFFTISFFVMSIKKLGIRIRKRDWITFTFTVSLITAITPSSLGSEPYVIYWLNKKIKNVKRASAITLGSNFIAQISSMIVTWPSFIYCMITFNLNLSITENYVVFWFLIIGISLDTLVFFGIIVVIYTKKIHYLMAIVFEKMKKILKKPYKSNQTIKEEIIENGDFKKEVVFFLKNWKGTFFSLCCMIFYNVLYYVAMFITMALLLGPNNVDFWNIFNITNIGVTANNFFPIPGSEGSLQIVLKILLSNVSSINVSILDNSIFIWRFSTTQFSSLIGVFLLLVEGLQTLSSIKYKKINENLKEKNKFLILVDNKNDIINNLKLKHYYKLITKDIDKKDIVIYEIKNNDSFILDKNKTINGYIKFLKTTKNNLKKDNVELRKILSEHNYISIYDLSMFSTKILGKKSNYIWVQYLMYSEYTGEKIFSNWFKNLIARNIKKIYMPYNPFYYNKNIWITHKCDLLIGNVNNAYYSNDANTI